MKRLCFIFGTRPEAIKLAPVILLARQQQKLFEVTVCVTGQHREMLDQMLSVFGIIPDIDLGLMQPNQSLSNITSRTIHAVDKVLARLQPDWILVQGDTTTVWTAAVTAFFRNIPVGHVEAGLRTNDKRQPFPEEINRRIASQVADLHFAPTKWAKNNLLAEGINRKQIFVTGNTVIDALNWILKKNKENPTEDVIAIKKWVDKKIGDRPMVLITGHRRESFGQGFENICQAIAEMANHHSDVCWVYPVHLNPNVQEPVRRVLTGLKNVYLIEPLPYAAFASLMNRSTFILTDSGGVQEEAPSLGKRVLVMRNKTERPEGVEAGVITLVGNDKRNIIEHCESMLKTDSKELDKTSPYGDGKASGRILDTLHKHSVNGDI